MSLYLKQFETQAAYEAAESGLILPNVSLTLDNNAIHYNPYVDPCANEKVKTTYEWVEIGGVKWATKNVGALTVTDYGQYFSWGEVNGYTADQVSGGCKAFSWADYKYNSGGTSPSAFDMTKYNSTDGKTVLEASDDAATVNMGSGWRMPTKDEYVALGNAVNTASTSDYQGSGVAGLICTDKTDRSKVLFFPACGYCNNGIVRNAGDYCYYLSSSLSNDIKASSVLKALLNYGMVYWDNNTTRCNGCSIRGVVNE